MAYEYEEVINLIVKTDQMNAGLKAAKAMFDSKLKEFEGSGINVAVNAKDFVIDLNKMERERLRSVQAQAEAVIKQEKKTNELLAAERKRQHTRNLSEEVAAAKKEADAVVAAKTRAAAINAGARAAINKQTAEVEIANLRSVEAAQAQVEANKRRQIKLTAEAQKATTQFSNVFTPGGRPLALDQTALSKEERKIAKELYQYRKDRDTELHNNRMAHLKAEALVAKREQEIAKALYQYRKDGDAQQRNARSAHLSIVAREEREIAKALYQYRKDGDAQQHNARMAQLRAEATAARDAAKFSAAMTPGGRPLAINPSVPAPASRINVSAGLRAGAGAAGALGAYPAAGTLYAAANAMQLVGMSTMTSAAAMTLFGGSLAIVGGLFATYKFVAWGAEFSRELAKMSTLMSDATVSGEEFAATLQRTADAALRISSAFNIDKIEVVRAFKEAFSSGIDPADVERFVSLSATFATAVGSDLVGSITLLTSVKDSYRLSITEMSEASDILFNAIDVGRVNVNELNKNFGRLSGVAAAAGVELNELAAFVATLTRQGMTTANAITSVIQVINGLQNPSDKAKKALDAAGIATGDLAFRGRHLIDVFNDLKAATGGAGDEIGKMFDEERARRGVTGAIRGINLYKNEVIPTINNVGTTSVASGRALDNLADNFGKRITEISNAVTAASAKSGGWMSQLMFGTPEDKSKLNAELVDRINKLKEKAKLATQSGDFNVGSLTTKLAGDEPTSWLTKKTGIASLTQKEGAAFTEYNTKVAEAQTAIESLFADVKDSAVTSLREIDDAITLTLASSMKVVEELSKPIELTAMTKSDNKIFNVRATDKQKLLVDDLTQELEIRQEILAEQEKSVRIDIQRKHESFFAENVTPIEDQMSKAVLSNDTKTIKELQPKLDRAKEQVEAFGHWLETGAIQSGVFDKLLGEINTLVLRIETIRANVSTQGGFDTSDFDKRHRDEVEKIEKEDKDKQIELKKNYNAIVEELYKADLAAYEKVEKKKEQINKESSDRINKETKKSLDLQAQIMNNILGAQASIYKDDPSAQARLGRSRRDDVKTKLDNAAVSGSSREQFDSLVKQYQEASDLVRSGTAGAGDSRRADRNYIEDQSVLGAINATFDKVFQQRERMNAQRNVWSQGSATVRSPQDIAKAAMEVQKQQVMVEQVVLDAKIKIDIDGNMSDATMNKMAEMVIEKIKKTQRNRNGPSSYDTSDREDSRVTAE